MKVSSYSLVFSYEVESPSGSSTHTVNLPIRHPNCDISEMGENVGQKLQEVLDLHCDNKSLRAELEALKLDNGMLLEALAKKEQPQPEPKKRGRPKKVKNDG